ncbi:DUF5789 family protein [Halostella litorea]|uniref:DUF5789 family protein n=1 Tax=Halostella litorea TaxID=2528831 RepID=UPI001092CBF2|nr:hypothetical protein [Halostella litorea]
MADDKSGRDKQARDAERRQRKRDLAIELERSDETEPPVDERELGDLEAELDSLTFPATGRDVVAAVGDRTIESADGTVTVEDVVPATDAEAFESPEAVRTRVQRPTVAAAMKRVVEAVDRLPNASLGRSQREAYEKTFRALKAVDADDDDEGVRAIADWLVDRVDEKGKVPDSRRVRRRAAEFCREHGYEVRNDEWLGV